MRNCNVYLNDDIRPIHIVGYIGHKIRRHGYSVFYATFRTIISGLNLFHIFLSTMIKEK